MTEKQLETKVKNFFVKNNIQYVKIHGGNYQINGLADLLVFHKFKTYAIEIKTDFAKSKPKIIQVLQAQKLKDDVICLFIDYLNFNFVLKNIKENNTEVLKHYSKKQLSYWLSYWQKRS
ncbi:hypothetical protein [Mycoplasmopsis felis]|uniref:hypothetical protein n=1 Tax=Mycoplasmopsis felis TaxID=33923 RepID=UPI002AFF77FC|nr:hypothetical protein [Mycoplasmopsis felis]WQQ06666.1 hypothetical protein RRG37_02315 [Mycoplasmopsis felis]WQQ10466.1 hypothetical protein RRG49_01885 [Mycoplasmopsis felis]